MKTIDVNTAWAGDGKTPQTAFRPAVVDDYGLKSWVSQDGQPGGVGTTTVRVTCQDTTATSIQADPKYTGKTTTVN